MINKNIYDLFLDSAMLPPLTIKDLELKAKRERLSPQSSYNRTNCWDFDSVKRKYYTEIEMAGFSKEKTSIKLSNVSSPYISISSSRNCRGVDLKFSKDIYVPSNCDYSTLNAKMENGILTISIELAKSQSFDNTEVPIS